MSVRSIFRELEDPDGAKGFISQYIDPIQSMYGGIDVDRMVSLLFNEWVMRRDANTHDLGALLDGGDRDDDGALALDEFMDVMHYCLLQKHGKPEVQMKLFFRRVLSSYSFKMMDRISSHKILVNRSIQS